MPVAAIFQGIGVNDLSSQGNFYFFDRIKNQEAQPSIENVELDNFFECYV